MASSRKTRKQKVEVNIYSRALVAIDILSNKSPLTEEEIDTVCSNILKFAKPEQNQTIQPFLINIYIRAVAKSADYHALAKRMLDAISNKHFTKPNKQDLYKHAIMLAIERKAFESDFRRLEIYMLYLTNSKVADLPPDIYRSFGAHYFVARAFEKAVTHFKALSQLKNIPAQFLGYINLGQCYKEMGNLTTAVEHYTEVIKIYEAHLKSDAIAACKEYISIAAHNCAKLLDNYEGDITTEPEMALYYYRVGAKLNSLYSLHDLGYKYENGEDVRRNFNTAIDYYRRASKLGNIDSLNNLFTLLNALKLDSSIELDMLEKTEDSVESRVTLMTYYLRKYRDKLEAKRFNDAETKEFGNKAFIYAKSTARLKPYTLHNLAVMYHFGIGVECNEHIAEKLYIESVDSGFEMSKAHLEVIYEDRLAGRKSKANFIDVLGAKPNLSEIEIPTDNYLKSLNMSLVFVENKIELDINTTLENDDLAKKNKIIELLKHNVSLLNVASLVNVIHQVGGLTEILLSQRQFHNEQLSSVFLILKEVEKRLALQAFDYTQIANLIEGLSKFYLQKNTNDLEKLFLNLYQEALRLCDKKNVGAQVKIIYAATRLEASHIVIKEVIPQLIVKVDFEKLDFYRFAKYYYAMAILSYSSPQLLPSTEIEKLIACSENMLMQIQSGDEFILRQNNVANYFFVFSHPKLFESKKDAAKQALSNLSDNFEMNTRSSDLQKRVIDIGAQYYPDYVEEEVINTFPVDAYFSTNVNEGFILQVDGPTHYLHALGVEPIRTQKTIFRNAVLSFSKPVVSVPYYKWDALKSDSDCEDYFKSLLSEINIKVGDKWKKPKQTSSFWYQQTSSSEPESAKSPRSARSLK